MVFAASGLIPTRFLTLTSHLTIVIIILWSRDENIKACLPFGYSEKDYKSKDIELKTGLGIALGLLIFEYIGFLSGISMFMPTAALVSVAAHSAASVLLSYLVLDEWDCNLYWWVFAFCSVLPALVEFAVTIGFLRLKKN